MRSEERAEAREQQRLAYRRRGYYAWCAGVSRVVMWRRL
jgi:hypothetical protein